MNCTQPHLLEIGCAQFQTCSPYWFKNSYWIDMVLYWGPVVENQMLLSNFVVPLILIYNRSSAKLRVIGVTNSLLCIPNWWEIIAETTGAPYKSKLKTSINNALDSFTAIINCFFFFLFFFNCCMWEQFLFCQNVFSHIQSPISPFSVLKTDNKSNIVQL